MRTQVTAWAGITILALAGALLAGSPARADEKKATGVWVYDLRIVRVDPPTKEGAEAPHPFESLAGTTTKKSWAEQLAMLKKRGPTCLLMDQRVTTMPSEKATAASDRSVPILALNFKDKNNAQSRAANVKTGCKLDVTPGPDSMRYVVQVRWATPGASKDDAPQELLAEWNGSHPNLRGDTLVLHYREQVPTSSGTAARAVEIYALLTGRLLTNR